MPTNFQQFDENQANILTDADYTSSTQRLNGVVPGLAQSSLHNKLFFQTSTMVAALGQALSDYGYTVADTDLPGLTTALKNRVLGDKIRTVTGTTDTIVADDRGGVVLYTNAGAIAVTLPQATATGNFGYSYATTIINQGGGLLTITPTTSVIDGNATLTLDPGQSVDIYSNNSNYFTHRGKVPFDPEVYIAEKTDTQTIATSTPTDVSGLSIALTVPSTTATYLIMASLMTGHSANGSDARTLLTDSGGTPLLLGAAAGNRYQTTTAWGRNATSRNANGSILYVHTPGVAGAYTYKLQSSTSAGTMQINRSHDDSNAVDNARGTSTLIVMRIK